MQALTSISKTLVELLRNREFVKAYTDLFSDDAVSFDPLKPEPLKGLSKLIESENAFLSVVNIQSIEISDAIHAGSYFTIRLLMKFSVGGEEKGVDELCVYKVSDGKIISQQFFIS